MMLEKYNKKGICKWLLCDDELHFQKIIYQYDEIYNTIKYYDYQNWRLQKMVYYPRNFILKCYVFNVKNSIEDETSYNINNLYIYIHLLSFLLIMNIILLIHILKINIQIMIKYTDKLLK